MQIGDTWRDWTLDSLLGEGTFGKVYKVVRNEFGHTYESALKVMRVPQSSAELSSVRNEGMEDDSITEYFRGMVDEIVGEFTLMSELRGHSNIVSYEDHSVTPLTDEFGWEICIRMELLTPLYKYLKEHTLTIRDVIALGIDICKALEVCQKFNLIHRDIKPENIFVSNIGNYKLGDFGIARQMEKTTSGMSKKGTYSYMAPEVYKGFPYNSTVDIYSLGIVLYRFLNNNRTPFLPPYPEAIAYSDREKANIRRMSGEPIPAPVNAKGRLAEIVLKACAYDPKDRYDSPSEMRRALESILYNTQEAGFIYPDGDGLGSIEASTASSVRIQDPASVSGTMPLINKSGTFSGGTANPVPRDPDPEPEPESELDLAQLYTDGFDSEPTADADDETFPLLIEDDDETHLLEEETIADPAIMAASVVSTEPAASEPAEHVALAEQSVKPKKEKKERVKPAKPAADQQGRNKKPLLIALVALVAAAAISIPFIYKYYHHEVPDLTGLDAEGARTMVEYADFEYAENRAFSDEVERNNVISQSAEPGSFTKKGAVIEVTISRGKAIPAPDLAGKSIDDATKAAKKAGLTVEVAEEKYDDKIGKDMIISQDIEPKTDCEEGQVIKVVKSKGITQVKVPDVTGKSVDDATKALKDAGFKVSVSETYSNAASGTIVDQSVAGGKKTDKGATITISKSKGPQPVQKKSSGSSSKKKKSSGKKKKSSGGGSSEWSDGNW